MIKLRLKNKKKYNKMIFNKHNYKAKWAIISTEVKNIWKFYNKKNLFRINQYRKNQSMKNINLKPKHNKDKIFWMKEFNWEDKHFNNKT
jgi:hypothetical protein